MEAIALLVMLVIFLGSHVRRFNRSQGILQQWAVRNEYLIIKAKYAYFFKGPFFGNTSRYQAVYRVLAQDNTGRIRSGWVCCGGWWFGMLRDEAQVRWDD